MTLAVTNALREPLTPRSSQLGKGFALDILARIMLAKDMEGDSCYGEPFRDTTQAMNIEQIFDRMWTVAKLINGQPNSGHYGFGWVIQTKAGHRVIEHGGAWQGFKIGPEYETQCRMLCYGDYPAWAEVQARFLELRGNL